MEEKPSKHCLSQVMSGILDMIQCGELHGFLPSEP